MTFLKKNWCLMIIAVLLFLLVYTIYTSSIPLPDVVNHVDDHITVGFSQIETDNPWRTTQINSFREAFGPSNIEFIYHEPEEYTAKWQQEDITKLIREKVDYLVIVPADLDALVPALQSAKEAGIPVILIEQSADTIDPDLYMSRISADYLREGAICAQLLAEKYAGRSCNIVEIYGTESSPSAKARSKGFHQALKNYPQLHIIDTEYGNFDRVTAQKAMENALVKTSDSHKSVQAVFAHSDEDGLGALQAIKTAGLSPNDISIVSINGIQDVCKAIIAGEYLGTVESNPKWGFIVETLINQRERGYTPFPTVIIPYNIITEANAVSYFPTAY